MTTLTRRYVCPACAADVTPATPEQAAKADGIAWQTTTGETYCPGNEDRQATPARRPLIVGRYCYATHPQPYSFTPAAADILGLLGIGITHADEPKIKTILAESGFTALDVDQALDDLSVGGYITQRTPGVWEVTGPGEDASYALWPTEVEDGWPR